MPESGGSRVSGVARGSKYALWHLLSSALALLFALGSPSHHAHLPLLALGFPLMYLLMFLQWLTPDLPGHWPPAAGLGLVLFLMTANSYLFGYGAAWVQRLLSRDFSITPPGSVGRHHALPSNQSRT